MVDAGDRVLVVGAGPTGLSLGLCLEAYGVPFDIVDAKAGPSRESKALALSPLSQDQLELFGHPNAVGANGCLVSRMNATFEGVRLNPIDLRWLDHDRAAFIAQPQDATERELIAALGSRGKGVDWRTEATGVASSEDGVDVVLRTGENETVRRNYAWVVGCDGKRSVVRDAIGAEVVGTEYAMHLVLGDFELEWDGDPRQAHYFVYEETFFVFAPVAKGRWRVVVKHDGSPSPQGPDPAAITEPVRRRFGRNIFRSGPSWISHAPLYLKIASRLRSGRMFIAGDAAHLFSPIGGTGMNTGMQDAFNLGWKLGFTLRGWASGDALLASYEEERLEAIRANAAGTDAVTRLIGRIDRAPEKWAAFVPQLKRRRAISRQFPVAQSGLGLRYSRSGAIASRDGADVTGRVGSVCRGLPALIRRARNASSHAPPYRVIACAPAFPTATGHATIEALARACAPFGPRVTMLVGYGVTADDAPPPTAQAIPLDATALRRLGLASGELVLVRPDGIVAYEGAMSDPDTLHRHLNVVLTKGHDNA